MTETQATSGAGTSATPAGKDSADGDPKAKGRAVVGRAVVGASGDAASSPKFTRAPGMKPPPDEAPDGAKPAEKEAKGGTAAAKSAPPVTKGKQSSSSGSPSTSGSQSGSSSSSGEKTERIPGAGASQSAGTTTGGIGGLGKVTGAVRNMGASAVGAARVSDAVRSARTAVTSAASRGPRRARLNVKRIDPWSVMKFSFAVSLVLFIVVIVATSVLYLALDAMGVFQSVNESLQELVNASGGDAAGGFKITARGVIGTSALIGLVNVVLFTALATLSAFIYNVCADLVGGVELTLAERD